MLPRVSAKIKDSSIVIKYPDEAALLIFFSVEWAYNGIMVLKQHGFWKGLILSVLFGR